MMWCPKPKAKVIRRPKPSLKQPSRTAADQQQQQQEKSDPHRDKRYFGFKHSDITRVFFVDSTNCVRDSPIGPFQKKQTDITAYLEHAVPSHATQTAPITTQNTRIQGKRNELGEIKPCNPSYRVPSACNNSSRSLRRDNNTPGAGAGHQNRDQNENIRPITAPTGEMRRLSAANSGHTTPGLSTNRSGTTASRRTACSKPGSVQTASRPGTRDSGIGSVQCSSTRGSAMGSLQCPSRLMTGTSSPFGSRLQSVPE